MSAPPVHLFEQHDEAYHIWSGLGIRGATVIHVDAHHDLSWLDDAIHLHIGNYLCQAIKDGIVGRVYWIVPDGALTTKRARTALIGQMRKLRSDYSRPKGRIDISDAAIDAELLGAPVHVCELSGLAELSAPVLLDVDTDFLLIPASQFTTGLPASSPWLRPSALAKRLRGRVLAPQLVTIAYSVEGGYTPLRWKYLGDELAAEFRDAAQTSGAHGFDAMWSAHGLAAEGRVADAEAALDVAAACAPTAAAASFARAILLVRTGRIAAAQSAYRTARRRDPSYATAYASIGLSALAQSRRDDSEDAFREILTLDDCDPHAHLGLGYVAAARRRWADVETHVRAALSCGLETPDAYRLLARSLERQRRRTDAVAALQRSLRLSLRDRVRSGGVIASRALDTLPAHDAAHARTYAALGALEARLGRRRAAIAALRFAISAGHQGTSIHARLAWLYTVDGRWMLAIRELGHALALVPQSIARLVSNVRDTVQRRLEALIA